MYRFISSYPSRRTWAWSLSLAFILLLAGLVTREMAFDETALSNKSAYIVFMVINCALLTAGLIYSKFSANSHFFSMIAAVCVLLSISISYQTLSEKFLSNLVVLYVTIPFGMVAYAVWRRTNDLTDRWFTLLTISIYALLFINIVFGVNMNTNAKLWISLGKFTIQPGEFIKILLILQAACCYRDMKRGLIYCVTALVCCGTFFILQDMGFVFVVFFTFLLNVYLIFDNKRLSLGIILVTIVAFVCMVKFLSHAQARFSNWFHVMDLGRGSQQRFFIIGNLLSGLKGLGFAKHHLFTSGMSAFADGSLAGVCAVFGLPMLLIVFGTYAILVSSLLHNNCVYPSSLFILSQGAVYISVHAMLNFGGSIDLLPFTGVVAPLFSQGNSAALSFMMLLGLMFAAMDPKMTEGGINHAR